MIRKRRIGRRVVWPPLSVGTVVGAVITGIPTTARPSRKQVRTEARRLLGPGSNAAYDVSARRRGGLCVVEIRQRPSGPTVRGSRILVARAPTWAKAMRQVRSGFALEV
jgi:hypothetical protein